MEDFHQMVRKQSLKASYDKHMKRKLFTVIGHVLPYDNRFLKFHAKLQMNWLGPFVVAEVRESIVVNVAQLNDLLLPDWVNNTRMKPFHKSNNVTQN